MPSFTCPDLSCGATASDPDLARLGYCGKCLEYTGRCASGRRVSFTGIAHDKGWPCKQPGLVPWELVTADGPVIRRLLCTRHDRQLSTGRAPWIQAGLIRLSEEPRRSL